MAVKILPLKRVSFSLYIEGMRLGTTREEVRAFFPDELRSELGGVVMAVKGSKFFAYVSMTTEEAAAKAIERLHGCESNGVAWVVDWYKSYCPIRKSKAARLSIYGVMDTVNTRDMYLAFSKLGEVAAARLDRKPVINESFGTVSFRDPVIARSVAKTYNNTIIENFNEGKPVYISPPRPVKKKGNL